MDKLLFFIKSILKNLALGALLFPVVTMVPIAIAITPPKWIWMPVAVIGFLCWLVGWFVSNFYSLLKSKK